MSFRTDCCFGACIPFLFLYLIVFNVFCKISPPHGLDLDLDLDREHGPGSDADDEDEHGGPCRNIGNRNLGGGDGGGGGGGGDGGGGDRRMASPGPLQDEPRSFMVSPPRSSRSSRSSSRGNSTRVKPKPAPVPKADDLCPPSRRPKRLSLDLPGARSRRRTPSPKSNVSACSPQLPLSETR